MWSIWIKMSKNDFFGFPKVKWLHVTGEMDVKFSQDLTFPKLLKLVNFWQSYSKNKNVDVFWDTGYTKNRSILCAVDTLVVWMVHWLTVAKCCMHLDERSASTLRLVQRATDRSEPNDSDLLNVDSTSWHRARPPCVSVMQSKSQACTREDWGESVMSIHVE